MGIEGDVLRNCGFVHIKEVAIFGVPAGELVTRTGGIMDGSQIVCHGLSDFFGLINRHLIVAGQTAAIGIKGHLAEVKEIAACQYFILFKQAICGGLIVVVVDGTIGTGRVERPSRTIVQVIHEGSQPGRERNVFQLEAMVKGQRSNGCYFFRDGDGLEGFAVGKSTIANISYIVGNRNRPHRPQGGARRKGTIGNGCQAFRECHSSQLIATIKHMESG